MSQAVGDITLFLFLRYSLNQIYDTSKPDMKKNVSTEKNALVINCVHRFFNVSLQSKMFAEN